MVSGGGSGSLIAAYTAGSMSHPAGRIADPASRSGQYLESQQALQAPQQHEQAHTASANALGMDEQSLLQRQNTARPLAFGSWAPATPSSTANAGVVGWGAFGYTPSGGSSSITPRKAEGASSSDGLFSASGPSSRAPTLVTTPHFVAAPATPQNTRGPPMASVLSAPNTTSTSGKRARSETPDMSDDERGEMSSPMAARRIMGSPRTLSTRAQQATSTSSGNRQILPKRMRAGLDVGTASYSSGSDARHTALSASISATQHHAGPSRPTEVGGTGPDGEKARSPADADLGRLLATLDRPSLLVLLSRLISDSADPTLPAQIRRHLPTPSLSSIRASLDEAEQHVRAVIPSGSNAAEIRAEWAWGRLRSPLQEYTNTVIGFLPVIDPSSQAHDHQAHREASAHPSTVFEFLHDVTLRLLRLQASLPPVPASTLAFAAHAAQPALGSHLLARSNDGGYEQLCALVDPRILSHTSPNTLMSQLAPLLLQRWSSLLQRISGAVNDEGRIFGQEMVRTWLSALHSLGTSDAASHHVNLQHTFALNASAVPSSAQMGPEERAVRQIFQRYYEALVQRVGWLVGVSL